MKPTLKLFACSTGDNDYDTISSAIVCAETVQEAFAILQQDSAYDRRLTGTDWRIEEIKPSKGVLIAVVNWS